MNSLISIRMTRPLQSPVWLVTSGSLFVGDHAGWPGIPDVGSPDPRSNGGDGLVGVPGGDQDRDFQNVAVSSACWSGPS
jgi:hypothetical protein